MRAIITIDGPSGAGKSTISRQLAERLNYTYLDTGAMYRAVGLKAKQEGVDPADGVAMAGLLDNLDLKLSANMGETRVFIGKADVSEAIRTPEMGLVASRVSAQGVVRQRLTELQRRLGGQGGVVVEGRDMGTVVFPEADCKFYLVATPEERAKRRQLQLREKGQEIDFLEILAQINKRDADDSARALAPLRPAADAVMIDSSLMSIEEVVAYMLTFCNSKGILQDSSEIG